MTHQRSVFPLDRHRFAVPQPQTGREAPVPYSTALEHSPQHPGFLSRQTPAPGQFLTSDQARADSEPSSSGDSPSEAASSSSQSPSSSMQSMLATSSAHRRFIEELNLPLDLPGLAIPEYPGCHNEAQPVPELDIPSPQASPSPAPPPAQTADNSFDPFNPPGEDPAWFPTISQEEQLVNARAKAIKPRENKRIAIISPDNGAELTPAEIKRIKDARTKAAEHTQLGPATEANS